MTDLTTENARLRAALKLAADRLLRCAVEYDAGTLRFIETGEWADEARAALATPAPDAPLPEHERDGFGRPINPATPQNAVYLGQHSVAPAPDAVQEAARVPEIAALIEAAKDLYETAIATKARVTGGICGQTIECSMRSTMHSASLFHLDVLNDALRTIAGDRT